MVSIKYLIRHCVGLKKWLANEELAKGCYSVCGVTVGSQVGVASDPESKIIDLHPCFCRGVLIIERE